MSTNEAPPGTGAGKHTLPVARFRSNEATELAHRARAVFHRLGDQWGVLAIQYHLGLAQHGGRRLEEALQTDEAALGEGLLARRRGDLTAAERHLSTTVGILPAPRSSIGPRPPPAGWGSSRNCPVT